MTHTRSHAEQDYIALWFDVRKELGIQDDMRVGPLDTRTGDVRWYSFPHSRMDGLGGLATILREHGYPCRTLPKASEKRPPGTLQLLRLMLRAPRQSAPRRIRWRHTYPDYAAHNPAHTNDAPIVHGYFSAAETAQIKALAKRHKVALNVYLFWALNRAVADHLLEAAQQYYWFYPINLRGALDFGDDTRNYSSGVNILLDNETAPRDIQQRIKDQIQARTYWVLWRQAHIGKWIGRRGVRWLYRYISERHFYAGSFSFLGNWPLKDADNPAINPNEVWVSCGIGTKNYPISTGILLWNDQLSLGLKLHPYICQDPAVAERCLADWRRYLLQGDTPAVAQKD